MTDKEKTIKELKEVLDNLDITNKYRLNLIRAIEYLQEKPVREDYEIYGSVAAVKALDRKRVCPQLKGDALHNFKNEFNTIKQIVHLLYDYEDPFCYRVALHWASWGAYNLKNFGNINEKEKAKMDISKEPVSEDLEKAAKECEEKTWFTPFYMALDDKGNPYEVRQDYTTHAESFKAGAEWQKAHNWKPADGDDLKDETNDM